MERLRIGLICLAILGMISVLALTWVEPDMNFGRAAYFVIVTISTVGFGDVTPQTAAGQAITVTMIVLGIVAATYAGGGLIQMLTEGQLRKILGYHRLTRQIQTLSDHFIICGCGRIGLRVAEDFHKISHDFVVVDHDPERLAELDDRGMLVLAGDAADEEVLRTAGVERAQGLVSVLPTDAENLFITLTARDLNPDLFIVARGENPSTVKKLQRAGANRVVSPSNIAAARVFNVLMQPALVDFMEVVTGRGEVSLEAGEFVLPADHRLTSQTLRQADVRGRSGVMVLGIRRGEEPFQFNPNPDETLQAGDMLLVVGGQEHLESFRKIFAL